MHETVVPYFGEQRLALKTMMTDCGREYVGRADQHTVELYTSAMNIAHRTPRPTTPFTNGFVERFHQTLKNEFFAKVFREKEKWYTNLEELQGELDGFPERHNKDRSHSGYRYQGRTPFQIFLDVVKEQGLKPALGSETGPQQDQPLAA